MDLIACQTPSRNRGIGRYTLELTRALANFRGSNEMFCMADPLLSQPYEELRQDFIRRLPAGGFLPYFHDPISHGNPITEKEYTQLATSLICQARQVLTPDVVFTPSLFEGWGNAQVVVPCPQEKKMNYQQVGILYDFIPYIFRHEYLDKTPSFSNWYIDRLNSLKNFDRLLAISEATRQDAIRILNLSPDRVVNISSGVGNQFRKIEIAEKEAHEFLQRLGINKPFVFYLGGNDFRKNMEGAVEIFANLPRELIETHQLVLNDVGNEVVFRSKIRSFGLTDKDVVIIDRILDQDLLMLYNLCTVFLFPSLYEGFGLPVLEAMACGAPVLAANNSSLPEVVGRDEMLFDVKDFKMTANKLTKVLTNKNIRNDFSSYGLKNSKRFSWDNSAKLAWNAMVNIVNEANRPRVFSKPQSLINRPRIAFLSPLPPQQSGISEYSAELLPYLSNYFDIELFVDPKMAMIVDERLQYFQTYSYTELLDKRDKYATVVYQFGNSIFHSHMFSLSQKFPGVNVLHDFYLTHVIRQMFIQEEEFIQELNYNHGIKSIIDYIRIGNQVIWHWPANWRVLRNAKEVIVHSKYQEKLLDHYYSTGWNSCLNIIPQMRTVETELTSNIRKLARKQLNIPSESFLICSFGQMGDTKMNDKTIEAFFSALRSIKRDCQLVFVGDCPDKTYRNQIMSIISDYKLRNRVHITGFVDPKDYHRYLKAADVAIQLRQQSRGETSRAVLDCMAYGIPVIINAHGTLNDYREEDVVKLNDPVNLQELCQVIVQLEMDEPYRQEIGKQARKRIITAHSPEATAAAYAEVIARAIESDDRVLLQPAIKALEGLNFPKELVRSQAKYAAENLGLRNPPRVLLDVSQVVRSDARSGIQRVVKSVVAELLLIEAPSPQVVPFYFLDGEWRQANRFIEYLLELPNGKLGVENLITISSGDILVMLDSSWTLYDQFAPIFENVRKFGGKIITMVYDLIPINFPQYFDDNMPRIFSNWFHLACSESDNLICISRTVAEEAMRYIHENKLGTERLLEIDFFRLGANIPVVSNESTIRKEVYALHKNSNSPLFLTVSTLEPRKGHGFTLDAFEFLWNQGDDSVLVFAGKLGWNMSEMNLRIRNHPALNKKFFFIENPTDAELEVLYSKATALIAASTAEGFGLPIVEAALHHVPALASDIPVFHEVGGEGAIYFSLQSPNSLAEAVKLMSKLTREERLTMAQKIKTLSWKESANQLMNLILNKN